jgi:hypothetical protein
MAGIDALALFSLAVKKKKKKTASFENKEGEKTHKKGPIQKRKEFRIYKTVCSAQVCNTCSDKVLEYVFKHHKQR